MKSRSFDVFSSVKENADEHRRRAEIIEDYLYKELARAAFYEMPEPERAFFSSTVRDEDAVSALRLLAEPYCSPGIPGARFAKMFASVCEEAGALPRLYDIFPHVDETETYPPQSATAAYVTGGFADAAFAAFRDELLRSLHVELRPHHSERVSGACDCVLDGDADCAIIPVGSSRDGELRSFYRMIDAHDLKLLATVRVAASSEEETRFALCGAYTGPIFSEPELFEFTVTGGSVSDITAAVIYHMHAVTSVCSYPSENGGFVHHFTVRAGGDLLPTLLYLNLCHKEHTVLGIYRNINEDRT